MNLPELVVEGIDSAFEVLQLQGHRDLLDFEPPGGIPHLSASDWELLLRDYSSACKSMLTLLRVKTAYLKQLPILYAGLAVADEGVARAHASEVLASFMRDPRKELHDPRTWELLDPDCENAAELQKFIAGTSRSECSYLFQMNIAVFRFMHCVETSIEEKHARASMAKLKHHIGPCRISLSNRLPMLMRWLALGQTSGQQVVDAFSCVRSLSKIRSELHI
eukprot:8911864-Pyramimonas_sp.AAC.1